uniref:Uncharacterized protein n=1 Tax=uncultured Flavobacteriia bacterium TaxID=212695 RepID=F4MN70_9BACT|nr:hypothetical protein [uncultured bacterium]CBL87583.1 hypothetical protein S18_920_0022 [uncultured Flavobacteriia bacterium]
MYISKRYYICTRYKVKSHKIWLNLLINSSLFQIYFFASKKKGFIFAPLLFLKQIKIYVH